MAETGAEAAGTGGGGEADKANVKPKGFSLTTWLTLIGTTLTVFAVIIESNRMRAYEVPPSINLVGFDIVELLISNAVFYLEVFATLVLIVIGVALLSILALVCVTIFLFGLVLLTTVTVTAVALAIYLAVTLALVVFQYAALFLSSGATYLALRALRAVLALRSGEGVQNLDDWMAKIRKLWRVARVYSRRQLKRLSIQPIRELVKRMEALVAWSKQQKKGLIARLTKSGSARLVASSSRVALLVVPPVLRRVTRWAFVGLWRYSFRLLTLGLAVFSILVASAWQYRNATFVSQMSVEDMLDERVPVSLRYHFNLLRRVSYLSGFDEAGQPSPPKDQGPYGEAGGSQCPDPNALAEAGIQSSLDDRLRWRICHILRFQFPQVTLTVGQRNGPETSQLEARPREDEQNTTLQFQTERYYYLGDFGEWAFVALAAHPDRRILVRRSTIQEASTFAPWDALGPPEPPKEAGEPAAEDTPPEPGTDLQEQLAALTARIEEMSRLQRAVLLANLRADLPSVPLVVPVPYLRDETDQELAAYAASLSALIATGVTTELNFDALINELEVSLGQDGSQWAELLTALNGIGARLTPQEGTGQLEALRAIATAINDLAQALPERSGTDPELMEELVRLQRALALQLAGQSETLDQIEAALVGPRLRPPVNTNWRWNWELSFQGNGGAGPATGIGGADAALMAALGQIGDNRITQALTVNACLRDGREIGAPLLFGEGARRLTAAQSRQLTEDIESFLATRRQSDGAEPLDLLVLGSASATGDPMGNLEISEDRAEHVAELIARAVTGRAFFDPDARHDALAAQNITLSAFGTGESSERGAGARQVRVFECGPTYETPDPEPGVVETASDAP